MHWLEAFAELLPKTPLRTAFVLRIDRLFSCRRQEKPPSSKHLRWAKAVSSLPPYKPLPSVSRYFLARGFAFSTASAERMSSFLL